MDAALLFCLKDGKSCINPTTVINRDSSSYFWPFWAFVILLVGFLVIGLTYRYGLKPPNKKMRDLEVSPGDISPVSEDEGTEEELEMGLVVE